MEWVFIFWRWWRWWLIFREQNHAANCPTDYEYGKRNHNLLLPLWQSSAFGYELVVQPIRYAFRLGGRGTLNAGFMFLSPTKPHN
jgi:hypothetical protein